MKQDKPDDFKSMKPKKVASTDAPSYNPDAKPSKAQREFKSNMKSKKRE